MSATEEIGPPSPKLLPGLAFTTTDRGLLIRGGPSTVLLPPSLQFGVDGERLRYALSGAMDLAAASTHLGTPAERLIDELRQVGLIDHSSDGLKGTEHAIRYRRRTLGAREPDGADDQLRRLRESAVVLIGSFGRQAAAIAAQLAEAGLHRCRVASSAEDASHACLSAVAASARRSLAVLDVDPAATDDDRRRAVDICAHAAALDMPVLFNLGSPARQLLGPVAFPRALPCPSCIIRSLIDESIATDETCPTPGSQEHEDHDVNEAASSVLASARVANEVCHILGPAEESRRFNQVGSTELRQVRSKRFGVIAYPNCGTCDPSQSSVSPWVRNRTSVLESAATLPPARFGPQPPMGRSRVRAQWEVARERARWEQRPVQPRSALSTSAGRSSGRRLSIGADGERLAKIAHRVITQQVPGRVRDESAMPEPGDYGLVGLFVVASDNPFGLPGTVFRYDDQRDVIEAVSAGTREPTGSSAALLARVRRAGGAALVLTTAVDRSARRHGPAAFRVAHFEAGQALARVGRAVSEVECASQPVQDWDEEIYAYLGVTRELESVAAVLLFRDL